MSNRYGHGSPEWKREGLCYDPAIEPDGPAWKARFDDLIAKIDNLYQAGTINNEVTWRIMNSWNAQMTYMQIVGILQAAYDTVTREL